MLLKIRGKNWQNKDGVTERFYMLRTTNSNYDYYKEDERKGGMWA